MKKEATTNKTEKAAHTPGPWFMFPDEPTTVYAKYGPHDNLITCSFRGPGMNDGPEARANARLIAAAPDLLAATSLFLSAFDESNAGRSQMGIEAMRAAILRAEGGK